MAANAIPSSSTDPARDAWSGQQIGGDARVHLGHHYDSSTSHYYSYGGSSKSFFARRKRNKLLGEAARNGGTKRVRALLQSGADVDYRYGERGETALHLAAKGGHDACVEVLLHVGSAVNALTEAKDLSLRVTALYLASERGHTSVVRTLLATDGIGIDVPGPRGSPLCAAVNEGHGTCAELLVRGGGALNALIEVKDGKSSLYRAAECGHTSVVRILLATDGIGIDVPGPRGSPLCAATFEGHVACVELLLRAGSAVNAWAGAKYKRTALYIAAECGHTDIVRMLLATDGIAIDDPGPQGSPLRVALYKEHIDIVKVFVERGAYTKHERDDILEEAIEQDNAAILECILSRRKHDEDYLDIDKLLVDAACQNSTSCLQLLLDHGAKVPEHGDFSVLIFQMILKANIEIIRILLERADPSLCWKQNAMCYATGACKPDFVQVLLDHGASANKNTEDLSVLEPPLTSAAKAGSLECVQLLIAAGADVTRCDSGKTALQDARKFKRYHLPGKTKDRYDDVTAYLEEIEAQQAAEESAVT